MDKNEEVKQVGDKCSHKIVKTNDVVIVGEQEQLQGERCKECEHGSAMKEEIKEGDPDPPNLGNIIQAQR